MPPPLPRSRPFSFRAAFFANKASSSAAGIAAARAAREDEEELRDDEEEEETEEEEEEKEDDWVAVFPHVCPPPAPATVIAVVVTGVVRLRVGAGPDIHATHPAQVKLLIPTSRCSSTRRLIMGISWRRLDNTLLTLIFTTQPGSQVCWQVINLHVSAC